ncbi:PREDICTED: POU domain, class 6, transcription factor 1-like isoform X2 [Amphimedon queenslandica]|uniref:POU domain protein n=1 Tax=Amphimedon queenslandica TaxID=400682 RepID=A0AAN0IY98_AMPQE|nr:PREDICTED: POU domain, class 6, transcription factor 1-like isoform X2 [Amphimedon queenslandica]|eukprot:XP_019849421.1 PREDICTED: POU domain, class 6, transcription factor 1-like isoform X2 [Amphimedon queenslandica]
MAAGHTLLSEMNTDKQALTNIFQFLKHQNLKETEEALKKELGIHVTTVSAVPTSSCSQPEEVADSYSKDTTHPRSYSTASAPVNATILVDDEEEDIEPEEEEEEEEGPRSWPGVARSPGPVQQQSFGPKPVIPFQVPSMLTSPPGPLLYKPPASFPMPTIFTLVPPGLLAHSPNGLINRPLSFPSRSSPPLMSTASGLQSPPALSPLTAPPSAILSKPINTGPTTTPANMNGTLLSPGTQKNTITLASIPDEELTPAHHELKAFAEEFKTKRIQLGYTQGAVGQSLADKGYSNFAQSTISRFEQMQLSPSNAATIMTVLKRWLYEAENPDMVLSGEGQVDPLGPPRKRKKRVVYTPHALSILNKYFLKEPRPNRQIIEMVAEELDLLPEEVRVWFCNKRQKYKTSNGEVEETGPDCPSPFSPQSDVTTSPPPAPVQKNCTKFTIEELSKSSAGHTSSQISFTSNLTVSHQVLRPMVFATRRQPVMVQI